MAHRRSTVLARSLIGALLLLAGAASSLANDLPDPVRVASGKVSGAFTVGNCTFSPTHVYAIPAVTAFGKATTILLLTDRPIEIGLAYVWDPNSALTAALTKVGSVAPGGLTVTLQEDAPHYFLWCIETPAGRGEQWSGGSNQAELRLEWPSDTRVEGSLVLAESTSGKAWNLEFAVDVVDPTANAERLPAGGGEAGKIYLEYLNALASSDIAALRRIAPTDSDPGEVSDEEIAFMIEYIRELEPATAEVTGGLADATAALLEIDGVMADGTRSKRRTLVQREGSRWVIGELSKEVEAVEEGADAGSEAARQEKTVLLIEQVTDGILMWLTDWAEGEVELEWQPGHLSADEVAAVLVPSYLPEVPATDAWGDPIRYTLLSDDIMNPEGLFRIQSAGGDGVFEDLPPADAVPFAPGEPGRDIIWLDGSFVMRPGS